MKNQLLSVTKNSLALFLLVMVGPAFALQADVKQMADFAADHVSFNDENGTTVYAGHVKMRQGTTQVIADKVIVYKDQNGEMDKSIATGNPVHYITLPDQQKNPMDASGDTIEYYPQKHIAIIIGNGSVTQSKNSLRGPYIVYDIAKQTLSSIPSSKSSEKSFITLLPWDLPGSKNRMIDERH